MRMAMMAITTSSSISVKAPRLERFSMTTTPWVRKDLDDTTKKSGERHSLGRSMRARARARRALETAIDFGREIVCRDHHTASPLRDAILHATSPRGCEPARLGNSLAVESGDPCLF